MQNVCPWRSRSAKWGLKLQGFLIREKLLCERKWKKPEKAAGVSDCLASSALKRQGGKKAWVGFRLPLSLSWCWQRLWGRFGGFGAAGYL